MPFQSGSSPLVTLAILLVLGGLIFSSAFPDVALFRWAYWAGIALALVFVAQVVLEFWLAQRDRGRIRDALNRLVALRNEGGPEAEAEGERLFHELESAFIGRQELEATEALDEAARKPGPHRIWCLRLVLKHLWVAGPPWQGVIREGVPVLEDADLPEHERARLEEWVRMDKSVKKDRAPDQGTPGPETGKSGDSAG